MARVRGTVVHVGTGRTNLAALRNDILLRSAVVNGFDFGRTVPDSHDAHLRAMEDRDYARYVERSVA